MMAGHTSHRNFVLLTKSIEGKNAAFPFIIGAKGEDDIFKSGLNRQRPEHAGDAAKNEVGLDRPLAHNGIHYVERRGAYVSVNNAKCN